MLKLIKWILTLILRLYQFVGVMLMIAFFIVAVIGLFFAVSSGVIFYVIKLKDILKAKDMSKGDANTLSNEEMEENKKKILKTMDDDCGCNKK